MPTTVESTVALLFKRAERRVDGTQPQSPPNIVERICFFRITNDVFADVAKTLPDNTRHKRAKIGRSSEVNRIKQFRKYRSRRRHSTDQVGMPHQIKGCQHCICKSHDSTIGIPDDDMLLRQLLTIDESEHVMRKTASTHTWQGDNREVLLDALVSSTPDRR